MSADEIEMLAANQPILMRNRSGDFVECRKVYFPLDEQRTICLIEIVPSDFREVPIHFLFNPLVK
jgi:hypothetical protein